MKILKILFNTLYYDVFLILQALSRLEPFQKHTKLRSFGSSCADSAHALAKFAQKLSVVFSEMMDEVDKNGDGVIDFDEFLLLMVRDLDHASAFCPRPQN